MTMPSSASERLASVKAFASTLSSCKASIISLLIGLALIALFPQVRDLLLEYADHPHLLKFAFLVLVFWALPVYAVAARALVSNGKTSHTWLPAALGIAAFFIALLGLWLTHRDILTCQIIRSVAELIACQGVGHTSDYGDFSDTDFGKKLATTSRLLDEVEIALTQLRWATFWLLGAAALFVAIVWKRKAIADLYCRTLARWPAHAGYLNGQALPWIYAAASLTFLAWLIIWPHAFTERFGRIALVPILAGAWVPIVGALRLLPPRKRSYIYVGIVLALLVMPIAASRFHDVRVFTSPQWTAAQSESLDQLDLSKQRQIFLDAALERWVTTNGCKADTASCPPLILVATEGGASRSAFFTATVLGGLVDVLRSQPERYYDLRKTLFSLSGVSGGSLGVGVTRTALAEATSDAPPCKGNNPSFFGSRDRYRDRRDPTKSWRACLQLLTTGDYLSSTIVGMALRDPIALPFSSDRGVLLEQAFERHYNRIVHGEATACGGVTDSRGLCAPFGYLQQTSKGSWLPLLWLNATSMDTGRPILFSDAFTAVTSAEPSSRSDLFTVAHNGFELTATYPFSQSEPAADGVRFGLNPYLERAHDVRMSTAIGLSARFPLISPAGATRYRRDTKDEVTAHVVDGGYFDNSGLETLLQIIPFLKANNLKIVVLYITNDPFFERRTSLAGRPIATSRSRALRTQLSEPELPLWTRPLSWIVEPLSTLYTARTGHAERALEQLLDLQSTSLSVRPVRVMRAITPSQLAGDVAQFCMDPPPPRATRATSLYVPIMNWWLSPVTQRVLDAQLCDYHNQTMLRLVLDSMQKPKS